MSFFTSHLSHIAIIAVPVIAILWALGPEVWRKHQDSANAGGVPTIASRRNGVVSASWPVILLAVGSLGAAAVHASVIREHFDEAALYGTFFVAAASVQFVYAGIVLVNPTRRLLLAGAVGNAAVIALWALTRFVAIPLGPDAGSTEVVGKLDLIATSFEVLAVVGALIALRQLSRRSDTPSLPSLPHQRSSDEELAPGEATNVRIVSAD